MRFTGLPKNGVARVRDIGATFLRPGDTVIDIGAATGDYTLVWADQVGPSGRVLAIEPHRASVDVLQRRCHRRPWVQCWSGAVGPAMGESIFYLDRLKPMSSSLIQANVKRPGKSYPVAVTTIDALITALPDVPRLIKVAAQGAEAAILRGATFALTLPIIWIVELWPAGLAQAQASVPEVLEPFQGAGYRPHNIWQREKSWHTVTVQAERRTGAGSTDVLLVPPVLSRSAAA